jgi:hypothetical protein
MADACLRAGKRNLKKYTDVKSIFFGGNLVIGISKIKEVKFEDPIVLK